MIVDGATLTVQIKDIENALIFYINFAAFFK